MDVVILKIESLRFFLPGLVKREKSIDTIPDVDRGNYADTAEILESVRFEVDDYCTQKNISNSRDNVRANIFLPTMNHDFRGHTFVLKIPPTLMKNMTRNQEHDISFCLGQGATGHVYEIGTPEFTRTIEHRIPPYLAEKIEPNLKWFTTHPLKSSNGRILGVLNVDGLNFELPKDEEINVDNIIKKHIGDIEKALNKQPKKEIFVFQKSHNKLSAEQSVMFKKYTE